jgi:hypothetical protein
MCLLVILLFYFIFGKNQFFKYRFQRIKFVGYILNILYVRALFTGWCVCVYVCMCVSVCVPCINACDVSV